MNRWIRLAAAVVAMIMIANLQYGWALFVKPLRAATGWKLSDVQWAFTIFIALETWAMPACGILIDRHGARWLMTVAGALCGIGWVMLGTAQSIWALYAWYALAGLGAAMVYCGSIGIGLKWFPDKRGLAAGIIAAGFGSGSAFFVPILSYILANQGYKTAFLYTGIAQGLIIMLAAQFLATPQSGLLPAAVPAQAKTRSRGENFSPGEMLRTAHFYIMYVSMLMMGIGGLMVTANAPGVADSLGIGAAILALALVVNPVANGTGRIFWGIVSDKIGRERAMIIAFLLQSLALVGVMTLGRISSTWFVITLASVYFTWGEVYVLFPSACTDFFGAKNASANYSFLYSTKGVASIVGGGFAAILFEKTGSWDAIFYGSAVMSVLAAGGAFLISRMPPPKRDVAADAAAADLQRA